MMPYPFDPFARSAAGFSFDQPYSRLFAPKTPTAREMLADYNPADEESTAGWLLEESLGGLGYLGSVLDKTFGARGIRGLLGGKPEELLSVLPFSDTLGFTDQRNEVSGRDLLADAGLATRRQPNEAFNWQDDLLGMGAEVLLDPSTYLTAGLTAAGKTALKAGGRQALAKGFTNQLRAGQRGLNFELPFTSIGADLIPGPQVADALSWMRSGATLPTRGIDAALGATTGYRPLQGAQRVFNENVGEPFGRYMSRLFDPPVKGRGPAQSQDVAREVTSLEQMLEGESLGDYAQRQLDLAGLVPKDAAPDFKASLMRSYMANIEGGDPGTLLPELQKQAKARAVTEMEKYLSPQIPGYDVDRANLTQWSRGIDELNQANQAVYDLAMQANRADDAMIRGVLPTKATDLLQELPHRTRVLGEVKDVFGEEARDYVPVLDAVAKAYAKAKGTSPDEYYKKLNFVKGGIPGKNALSQEQNAIFYSKLSQVVEQKMSGPMDAEQLKKMLQNNGVKPDEMQWSGINDLQGKLTKDQVMEHLAENGVQVKEVLKGDMTKAQRNAMPDGSGDAGKYGSYQTPGGENYKELLLTLPSKKLSAADEALYAKGQRSYSTLTPAEADRFDQIAANANGKDYVSGHWDEPNVLAHIRMNDRVGPDGKKILFVEEIQSDWHQTGREKGYKSGPKITDAEAAELAALEQKNVELYTKMRKYAQDETPESVAAYDAAVAEREPVFKRLNELHEKAHSPDNRVPDAPFKKNWEQLAMKRVMRYAAENGYDRVSWLPGAEQAKRYDLSKQVSRVYWNPEKAELVVTGMNGEDLIAQRGVYESKLADYIGKEAAEKIVKGPSRMEGPTHVLEGSGLQVGGEGMKGFYDQKLVNSTNDLIKKYGAKVEPSDVPVGSRAVPTDPAVAARGVRPSGGESLNAPGFDVTPQMKAEVMKGQPLFQDAKGSYEVTNAGKRIIRNLQGGDLSTLAHESSHDFMKVLPEIDNDLAEQAARATGAKDVASMTKDNHEVFARGFEKYMRDGIAPSGALAKAFETMKNFLVDLYKTIVGTPLEAKLNPELKQVFDELLRKGDDIPMPKDTPTVALVDAASDLINKGFLPDQLPGGALRFNPTDEVLGQDRKFIRDAIKRDDELGPRSLIDLVNDPDRLEQKAYSRELGKFMRKEDYDLEKLFTDPRFGGKAATAFEKLAETEQYKRVMKIDKALEYTPPKGAEDMAKWAAGNLDQKQLADFNTLVDRDKQVLAKFKEVEKSVGARGGSIVDSFINYMSRQMTKYPADDPRAATAKAASNYWRDLKASNEAFEHRKEIFKDVPGGTATINSLTTDPRMSGPNRTMTPEQIQAEIRETLTGMADPSKKNPAWKQAKGLEEWLGGLPADHAEKQIPFFSADLPNLMFRRQKGMNEVQAVAKAAEVAISRFSKPAKEFEKLGQESMSIKEFLTRMNLTGADEGGSIWAQKLFDGPVAKGEKLTLDDVKHIHLEKKAAEDILKMNQAAVTPDILKPVIDGYDFASGLTKTYLTRPFVSFHTRNLLSGLFNTWRSTGGVGRENMAGVIKFLQGGGDQLVPGLSKEELWKELVAQRIAFTPNSSMQADILGAGGEIVEQGIRQPGGSILDRIKQIPSDVKEAPAPFTGNGAFIKLMSDAGQSIEDFTRVNHYVTLRKQGWKPEAAGQEVLKYQIDYRNLTGAERSVFRRMFPWYGFCVPESYEILSRNGWKTHDQLVVGEDVLSLNHTTGEMEWVPVEAINVFEHDGPMHVLEGRGCKWLSTENHRWPTHRRHTRKKIRRPEFVESWQLNDSDAIPRCGEYRGSVSILSPRLAAILGWVVTDGSFRCRQIGNCLSWEMVVYQSEKKYIGEVEDALGNSRRAGADRRTVRTTSAAVSSAPVHTVAVRREDIRAITKFFRTKADLPGIVGRLSREAAEAMFDAMMMAEGSMSATGQQHFKQCRRNAPVLEAFQMLCYLTGRSANINSDHGCYVHRNKTLYVGNYLNGEEHYSGKVWCPTTKHGTWVMRANGKAIITGNSKGTLPTILSDLVDKPSNITLPMRAVTGGREPGEFVPSWIGEGAALPLGTNEDGSQRFVSSFGLPVEDESFKMLGSLLKGDVTRAAEQGLGATFPWLKFPLEATFGKQLYSGRPLSDLRPYEWSDLGGLLNEKQARLLTEVVSQTPVSRAGSTASRLMDERKGVGDQLWNMLTGARITDVDKDRAFNAAVTREIGSQLLGQPGVRSRQEVYVPLEKIPNLTPADAEKYALYLGFEQRMRELAKKRKESPRSP